TLPGEQGMLLDVDLHIQVAGRPASRADFALAAELHSRALIDTGGNVDGDRAAGPHPAFARTFGARIGDRGPEAVAGRARSLGADIAEQRALHALHRSLAVTGTAGGGFSSVGGAAALACGASHSGVDLELSFGAECRIGQADRQPQERVLSALHPRTRAAGRAALTEARVHDVVETEALRESAAAESAAGGIAAAVIHGTFLWIRKNLVRLGGFLEFLGRIGAVVDVRMKPAGLFPVRLLDVFGRGVPVNPEQ